MYKLVAKNGRGFVVAGATRAGAAPQLLKKGVIENTNKTTKAFTVGDVRPQSECDCGLKSLAAMSADCV